MTRRHVAIRKIIAGMLPGMVAVSWLALHQASSAQEMERHKAAVVKIVAQQEGRTRTGTGFVVKAEPDILYVVTAAHVVEGDSAPLLEFFTARNRKVKAEVIRLEGGDAKGLALLAVRGRDRPPEPRALVFDLGAELQGGESVTTIGFGRGQGDWAVLQAQVISVDGRDVKLDGRIEEGNSGGPVLRNGQVVGLITSQQGIGLATPAQFVRFVLRSWGVDVSQSTAKASNENRQPPAHDLPASQADQADRSPTTPVPPAPMASAIKPGDASSSVLTWQDHALRFVGSVREDLAYPVIRARVYDVRTGAELGTFDAPVVADLSQAPVSVILVASFNIPADSTTPTPHVHVSNLRFEVRADGFAGLVQNCDLLGCYPASGTLPLE
jgi:hypothetical protein